MNSYAFNCSLNTIKLSLIIDLRAFHFIFNSFGLFLVKYSVSGRQLYYLREIY